MAFCAMRQAPGGESVRWAVPSANPLAWQVWDDEFLCTTLLPGRHIILTFWPEKRYLA
jgi:hypothetical protein